MIQMYPKVNAQATSGTLLGACAFEITGSFLERNGGRSPA